MPIKTVIARLHLWLGLILGLQVMLWIAGGAVMSWFHITMVRGEHNIAEQAPVLLTEKDRFAPLHAVLGRLDGPAIRVDLSGLRGETVYRITLEDGTRILADAMTGEIIPPLDEAGARAVARADFAGEGDVIKADYLTDLTGITEYRRDPPVWRITFDDPEATRLYISPETGLVTARRNRIWRIFDFFWMLHIMDYDGRSDFNNPLLKVTALSALLFSFSGLALVLMRFWAGRFGADLRLLLKRRDRRRAASSPG